MRTALTTTIAILVAAATGLFTAGLKPMTVDEEMKLRSIVDVRISPDGGRVAYVLSTPVLAKNEHEGTLFVVPAQGGTATRIGESVRIFNAPVPRPQLRWLPDNSAVALVAFDVGNRPQAFAIPVNGGPPRALTAAPEGVFGFEVSPDGSRIAYLTRDAMPPDEARARQDKSFVIRAGEPDRPIRLVVQNVDSAKASAPTTINGTAQYVDGFGWSPDSREVAFSAAPRAGFSAPYETRIYTVSADGGTPRAIVDRAGMNTGPRYSPDGKLVAFISTNGRSDIMASRSLTVASTQGGAAPRVFGMDDAWVNEYVWAPDSRSIYTEANDGTFARGRHMFEQPVVRVSVADGRAESLSSETTVAFSLTLSNDGRTLAFKSVGARTMGDVSVMDVASRRVTTITDLNPQTREFALGTLKPLSWKSFDGMEVWGLLLTPSDAPAGRRLPLLVYVHGGPGGGFTYGLFPQFMHLVSQVDPYPTTTFASRGYAVLYPMPRGGAGYGEAGQRAIVNAWGEGDYQDIMAGVDKLVADGIADADRLGVMGASYGGYMTNWIVTQTGRFKAASSGASISDLADTYYLSEGGQFMADYFKRPWENAASYAQHSPLTHVSRVTTPLLIQHGEADPRVPIDGAWKFYRALKAMGKTVELEIYPRGGHVLREPMQQREQMRRNVEWFTRWIK
jgi:dipeptidyl aminopeptidase/acylaminoacyl peptidase